MFYEEQVKNYNIILECGCGTGRLITFLSKKFPDKMFYGIDINNNCLKICESKIKGRNNVILKNINMLEIKELNIRPDLIIFPFRSFMSLVNEKDIESIMAILHIVLAKNGSIIMTFFDPNYSKIKKSKFKKESKSKCITKYSRIINVNYQERIFKTQIKYIVKTFLKRKSLVGELNFRYYEFHQIKDMLQQFDYEIIEAYSNYKMVQYDQKEKREEIIIRVKPLQ